MDVAALIEKYPLVYHMAAVRSWSSIQHHGLLSTTAILDLFEVKADCREAIESRKRPESVVITHPQHGTATIRDQKPIQCCCVVCAAVFRLKTGIGCSMVVSSSGWMKSA
jgi:Family of unknown function (DUF7002)